MKKIVILIVLLVVALGGWWKYRAAVREAEAGDQGDPVRAFQAFMDGVMKLNRMTSGPGETQPGAQTTPAEAAKPAEPVDAAEQRRQAERNVLRLFEEEQVGRKTTAACGAYRFDSYNITDKKIAEDTATVTVQFQPTDIPGLKKQMMDLGAPNIAVPLKLMVSPFILKKSWHRWYIVEVSGDLATASGQGELP
jgi:hypothetical protein